MAPWLVLLCVGVGSLGTGILVGVLLVANRGAWHDVRGLPKDDRPRRRRADVEDRHTW